MTNQYVGRSRSNRDSFSGCSVSLLVPSAVQKPFPGDQGSMNLRDGAMWADVERTEGLNILLCVRLEALDESDWMAFAQTPGVVSVLATPMLAWFTVEIFGTRFRAPLVVSLGPDRPFDPRRILETPRAHRTITLFGISGTGIRSRHVGIGLARIWQMLDDAIVLLKDRTAERDCYEAARRALALSADATFAAAMRQHLRPLSSP